MTSSVTFSPDVLKLDAAAACAAIEDGIREIIAHRLKRKGAVVAISGGIDSSVVAALCTRALGPDRVLGLLLPETDSSPESARLANLLAAKLGIRTETENIAGILDAAGCYRRRDDAIRSVVPEYTSEWKSKIVLPDVVEKDAYQIFSVVVQSPAGSQQTVRLTADAYLGILAATNFKQRTRKMMEYYYADRYKYAVAATPNRLEYDQGFFVKAGDGAGDLKPIAHLYKSQVYQLAEYMGVPREICERPPTTDTYSLEQSQEEFYFVLPLEMLDLCLYAKNNGVSTEAVSAATGLAVEQVRRAYAMIEAKRKTAVYLHAPPQLVCAVD